MPVETPSAPAALPVRTCGTCTLCCRLPDIDALAKPANTWCIHCSAAKGCTIYPDRPQLCRDFLCLWMTSDSLGPEWEPAKAKMMVYTQGPQITVLVDPAFPQVWRHEPYASAMRRWAADAKTAGGYVIVFVGEDVIKIDAGKTLAG